MTSRPAAISQRASTPRPRRMPTTSITAMGKTPEGVEAERSATQLRPLPLEGVGVLDREVAHQVAEDADREVDEEDPAPVVVDRDVAAERRADDRGGQPRHAEDRHCGALLLGRE